MIIATKDFLFNTGEVGMRKLFTLLVITLCQCILNLHVSAQIIPGEVTGTFSGVVHKLHGDFTSTLWGPGAMISLQYAPIRRLGIEARVGLGEIQWNVSPTMMARYPQYYGYHSWFGKLYPRTTTTIDKENESRISTVDLLLNYSLVTDIPAVPFISAGVGMIDFAPSTNDYHEALPNLATGRYTTTAFSIPLGGGFRIPFSYRAALVLRGEYRFVFSKFLDDVAFNNADDGITSVSLGLSYRFTNPPKLPGQRHFHRSGVPCPCDQPCRHGRDCPWCKTGSPQQEARSDGGHDEASSLQSDGSRPNSRTPDADTSRQQPASPDTAQPGTPNTEMQSKTNDAAGTAQSVVPCAPGTQRVCVDADHSICAEPFTPNAGADRIRWEDAFVYAPGDPLHNKTVGAIGAETPCYTIVVRQTSSAYYVCEDCCFQQQMDGGNYVYVIADPGRYFKAAGQFKPDTCKDCVNVAMKEAKK